MIGGIIEVSTDGYHLSVYRGFLKISEDKTEIGRVQSFSGRIQNPPIKQEQLQLF